jgi:hypothetical protein
VRASKFILAGLVLALGTLPAVALMGGWLQSNAQRAGGKPPAAHSPGGNSQAGNYQFHLNGPGPHRGDWLRKYGALPSNQQEQQLKQDPNFRNLAPQDQQRLLERLRNFNSLPPDSKARVLDRMETFEHLTPQQQRQVRGLFQQYKSLPEDRQGKVSQAYHQLRDLPPDQRNQLLSSDEYRNSFNDQERDLLRGMTDLTNSGHNP